MCLFILYRSICVSDNLSVGLSLYFVSYAMHVRVFPWRRAPFQVDLDRSYSALLSTLHRGDHEATEDAIADVVLLTHLHEWMETGSVEPRASATQLTRSSPGSRRDWWMGGLCRSQNVGAVITVCLLDFLLFFHSICFVVCLFISCENKNGCLFIYLIILI